VFGKDKDGIWLHDCFSLGSSATNCLLRVTDGAELYADRYIWPSSRGTNRIEVTNGGKIDCQQLRPEGTTEVLIDDATIKYNAAYGVWLAGDARITFRGTHPRLHADDTTTDFVTVRERGTLRFELPVGSTGYEDVPITTSELQLNSTTHLEIGNVEEFRKGLETATDIVLAQAYAKDLNQSVSSAVLNEVNATLPKGCSVYYTSDEPKLLKLRLKPIRGLIMVIR